MQVLVDDLNVNFQVYGSGLPIVVLHGWGDSGLSWYAVAQLLANKYQLILVDLPGFGGSDDPKTVWGVEEYSNIVKAFINELGLERPILIGHSHGGKVACTVALEPKYCLALILVSSQGVETKSLLVTIKILAFKTIKQLLRPFGKTGADIVEHFRKQLGSRDYQQAERLRPTLVKLVNQRLFHILPKVSVPSLIVWGSKDKTLHVKQAKVFERLIPDSYIRIIWGGSHHPHIDSPQELAEIVASFLPVP